MKIVLVVFLWWSMATAPVAFSWSLDVHKIVVFLSQNRVSIICLFFSHGNEGIFYGYDGAYPAHKVIVFVIYDKL